MPEYLPVYDEIFVISDLHMGGEPGFQILRETERLARFIDRLTAIESGRRVALLLNGDIFDTLAEASVKYVAMLDAVTVVRKIMDRDAFKPIWDSLAGFTQTDNRFIVFVVGNHDIELALPPVQRMLIAHLVGKKPSTRARIEFSTTGSGYPCLVGDASVFCTHGNETDEWNFNRYEDLSRLARRVELGQELKEWSPNAGTKMVKDVMNDVKKKFRWIDLLKPEKSAAFGTLLALDPGRIRELPTVASIVPTRIDSKERDRRLNERTDVTEGPGQYVSDSEKLDHLLGPNLRAMRHQSLGASNKAEDMLLESEDALSDAREMVKCCVCGP